QLSKFIEYLSSFFGFSSTVRASILTNFSLSAHFIARYIMNAIKNGFNYLAIVFPIRKTLNNFMALRVFDTFVKRKSILKQELLDIKFNNLNRRMNLIFLFVFLVKYKLFFVDIYIYLINFSSIGNFVANNCFEQFNKKTKYYYKKKFILNYRYFSKCHIGIRRNFFFNKRFFSYKEKFYKIFKNRLIAELIQNQRYLKQKPITIEQKLKYNESRRLKRAKIRFESNMIKVKKFYNEILNR